MAASRAGELGLIGQIARHARSSWPLIAGLFAVSVLASPLALLQPLPLKLAVDNVLDGQPLPGILDAALPAFITSSTMGLLVFVAAFVLGIALLSQLQALARPGRRTRSTVSRPMRPPSGISSSTGSSPS
jgi:ATP-binding cassette subfamily B protein